MSGSQHVDLEIKDAQLIFQKIWEKIERKKGRQNMRFPREIIWLGGAPGSGKGTNTEFIMSEREINSMPIVISTLLTSPMAKKLKDDGCMVGDREVIEMLFNELLENKYENGVVVDGFPRTKVQVECLKILYQKMIELRLEFKKTPMAKYFKQPMFRVVLLFVEENVSVERQLKRGIEVKESNRIVEETGAGVLLEDRVTDNDPLLARKRYQTFKEKTYEALKSLRELFHYHYIDASGHVPEVEQNIRKELQYQSLLELDNETYDFIRRIPLANDLAVQARKELVKRLDGYAREHRELFEAIIELIEKDFMPLIIRHSFSGEAHMSLDNKILESPLARSIFIDIFSERGYHAIIDQKLLYIPDHFDEKTRKIFSITKQVFEVFIRFKGSEIRRGN